MSTRTDTPFPYTPLSRAPDRSGTRPHPSGTHSPPPLPHTALAATDAVEQDASPTPRPEWRPTQLPRETPPPSLMAGDARSTPVEGGLPVETDRKSTRLNSSH